MKKAVFFCLLFSCWIYPVFSQLHWDSLHGGGFQSSTDVDFIYADSNYIYVLGQFDEVGGIGANDIARWNGVKWDSMGSGINSAPFTGANVGGITTYHNKLYVGGIFFTSLGNVKAVCIGTWNGTSWDSMPIQPFDNYYDGAAVLTVINNKLYMAGVFDSVAGKPNIYDIASWNDTNWSGLNFPNLENYNGIHAICEYNGSIYVGGNFYGSTPNDSISNILRWDGTNWHSVGGGIKEGGGASINFNCMVVYNGDLYVAGSFSKSGGNAGNNIQKWDGTSWSDVGGGTDYQIFDLLVYKSKLYALGNFDEAGGVPASYIATWDGTKWCSLGDTFDNSIGSGCIYKDSLYIGGGFWTIDGDSISYMAEWTGGNYTDGCGNDATGVNQIKDVEDGELKAYPNPAVQNVPYK